MAEEGADKKAEEIAGDSKSSKSAVAAGTVDTLRLPAEQVINRRSRWTSSLAALRYVSSVSRDNEVKVRDSDKATAITLVFCCAVALATLTVPQLEAHRVNVVLAADGLVGIAVLAYVANRFGIVTTFHPRQALLTWQLMLGSSLLGIWLTINLALIIAFVLPLTPQIVLP